MRPRLDPEWVEEAFSRVEELAYSGDPAALAKNVASLARERALLGSVAEEAASSADSETAQLL